MSSLLRVYELVEQAMPERDCQLRGTCCRFAETGREPFVTLAELQFLLAELKRQGRRVPAPRPDGSCPLLLADGSGCSVYNARPFGCRTHFCREAGGQVPARQVRDAIQLLNQLDESAKPAQRGGRPLTAALKAAGR